MMIERLRLRYFISLKARADAMAVITIQLFVAIVFGVTEPDFECGR